MRSFRNNNKRHRYRGNGDRNFSRNIENQSLIVTKNFQRNSLGRNNQNISKLIEKYNNLAREALSNGDKILSENYFQHADHFMRILSERKSNQNKIKTQTVKSDIQSSEKEDVKINQSITEKKE